MGLKRETCHHPGCNELQLISDYNYRGTGQPYWRKWCETHYKERRAKNAGMSVKDYSKRSAKNTAKNAGYDSVSEYQQASLLKLAKESGYETIGEYKDHLAREKGFKSHVDYVNSTHPYRQHRKEYCENYDGSVNGYKCTYPKTAFKKVSALLHVDHKDGDPTNNDPSNLQTLCPNCHTYKTHINGDCKTPGRKTLKES